MVEVCFGETGGCDAVMASPSAAIGSTVAYVRARGGLKRERVEGRRRVARRREAIVVEGVSSPSQRTVAIRGVRVMVSAMGYNGSAA